MTATSIPTPDDVPAYMAQMTDDSDVLVDPRMAMSFYGVKTEKDVAADSPSQFMMTPRMFADGDDNDDFVVDLDRPSREPSYHHAASTPRAAAESVLDAVELAPLIISPPSSNTPPDSPRTKAPPSSAQPGAKRCSTTKRQPTASRTKRKRSRAQPSTPSTSPAKKGSPCAAAAAAGRKTAKKATKEDARRHHSLERNRVAASKCREKKKQWVHELESKKAELEALHASLLVECTNLLEESTQIKNLLMDHAACHDPNIDMWLDNEATRFVHRPSDLASLPPPQPQPPQGSARRHSSIGSLMSLQSQNDSVEQPSSTVRTEDATMPFPALSPVLKKEPINYDYMPDELFRDD
ncbi:hypothetical protein RJ55_02078 [Drechmeria coniospora]|nr:hypothetical protein RJ55_02078 [Drechmeria coniospora]